MAKHWYEHTHTKDTQILIRLSHPSHISRIQICIWSRTTYECGPNANWKELVPCGLCCSHNLKKWNNLRPWNSFQIYLKKSNQKHAKVVIRALLQIYYKWLWVFFYFHRSNAIRESLDWLIKNDGVLHPMSIIVWILFKNRDSAACRHEEPNVQQYQTATRDAITWTAVCFSRNYIIKRLEH